MSKFEYKITKIGENGIIWTNYVIIRANEKLDALAKIEEMFPTPQYSKQFIQTC